MWISYFVLNEISYINFAIIFISLDNWIPGFYFYNIFTYTDINVIIYNISLIVIIYIYVLRFESQINAQNRFCSIIAYIVSKIVRDWLRTITALFMGNTSYTVCYFKKFNINFLA